MSSLISSTGPTPNLNPSVTGSQTGPKTTQSVDSLNSRIKNQRMEGLPNSSGAIANKQTATAVKALTSELKNTNTGLGEKAAGGVLAKALQKIQGINQLKENLSAVKEKMSGINTHFGKSENFKKLEADEAKIKKSLEAGENKLSKTLTKLTDEGQRYFDEGNYEEAIKHFELAAEQGDAFAHMMLGRCYFEGNYDEGIEHFMSTANPGNASAAKREGGALANVMLGRCYYEGKCGVDKDFPQAKSYFDKAAKAGDTEGKAYLGMCFYNGEGCEKNYVEAFKWFNEAAKQRHPDALFMVGQSYYEGSGVARDPEKAVENFKSSLRYENEQIELGEEKENKNLGNAETALALAYLTGEGIKQDVDKAKEHLISAGKKGNETAKFYLEYCFGNGDVTPEKIKKVKDVRHENYGITEKKVELGSVPSVEQSKTPKLLKEIAKKLNEVPVSDREAFEELLEEVINKNGGEGKYRRLDPEIRKFISACFNEYNDFEDSINALKKHIARFI